MDGITFTFSKSEIMYEIKDVYLIPIQSSSYAPTIDQWSFPNNIL